MSRLILSVYFISIISSIILFWDRKSHNENCPLKEAKEYSVCKINQMCDLEGDTVFIPRNCTLIFKKNGGIKNGFLKGENVRIKYSKPFIGESVIIQGCRIIGKKVIKDNDVFLAVAHTQGEIQTLFDLSHGIKVEFSQGCYQNIERIEINNSVDADFNNSIIQLYRDENHVGECFYMEPWVDKHIDYVKISNLKVIGERSGFKGAREARRCIQFFYVSEVVLDNILIDKFYGGPNEFSSDSKDLLDKTRIGTCAIAIMKYDKCTINNCSTNDISKEIFWCVPNSNPNNITYFTNNKSTCSTESGSASFLTLLDGRCIVSNNEVHDYNGSAFNVFCYDSDIFNNKFYDGKRSVAIDLSEGTMYRAKKVRVHDNECINTKGLLAAFGEDLVVNNNSWVNDTVQTGNRFAIITINSRNERVPNGRYIGSDNNLNQDSGSNNIIVSDNVCLNRLSDNELDIRCASISGENISFLNNIMDGMNMPVVQVVDGKEFCYMYNTIIGSKKGNYAELFIKLGNNITVTHNTFHQNNTFRNMNCTVQAQKLGGRLSFSNNSVDSIMKERKYVPFYVNDYTELHDAEVFVDKVESDVLIDTGLKKDRVKLKTNILE